MKQVVIIGGGFAGLSAAGVLTRHKKEFRVTLIDKSSVCNFLPLLPDVIGRDIPAQLLTCSLEDLGGRMGFDFLNREVLSLDTEKKEVSTDSGKLGFDYLLVACGSETNFYGNDVLRKHAFKLDDAQDAKKIRDALDSRVFDAHVIAGGGYTGIEIATNLRRYLERRSKKGRIVIVERVQSILGLLPEWMKQYALANLKRMDIEVRVNTVIEKTEEGRMWISGNERLDNSLLIWAAGVKIPAFTQNLKTDRSPQGRMNTGPALGLGDGCFAAGDAANFSFRNSFLRMGVQFAVTEGVCAAMNIINSVKGRPLLPYRPMDPGYVVPMANDYSCARIFGVDMKGRFPTFLHYFMCVYRSCGWKNRRELVKRLLSR